MRQEPKHVATNSPRRWAASQWKLLVRVLKLTRSLLGESVRPPSSVFLRALLHARLHVRIILEILVFAVKIFRVNILWVTSTMKILNYCSLGYFLHLIGGRGTQV